jgi:hypothetical protein
MHTNLTVAADTNVHTEQGLVLLVKRLLLTGVVPFDEFKSMKNCI